MLSFKSYLSEEELKPKKLGDVASVGTNMEDADFWITRRGSIDKVGYPTKDFHKEHFGIKITKPNILDPKFAYYMMQHIANTGHFRQHATGMTNLVNIRSSHINDIPLNFK
jgi:hypothetical protein